MTSKPTVSLDAGKKHVASRNAVDAAKADQCKPLGNPMQAAVLHLIDERVLVRFRLVFGSVPEWLMGADCKSAGSAYVGSNPTRPILHMPL